MMAHRLLTSVVRESPASSRAWHLTAIAERRLGMFDASRKHFERAISLDGGRDPAIYGNFANLLDDLGEHDEAIRNYREALKLRPDFPDTLVNLGLVCLRQGRLAEAKSFLQRAVEISPGDVRAWHGFAMSCRAVHDLDQASVAIEKALALKPDTPSLLHIRALIAAERGEPAVAHYRQALEAQPGNLELRLGEAIARSEEGDMQDGIAAINGFSAARPDWVQAHAAFAKLSWEAGDTGGFTRGFRRAIAVRPLDPELRVTLIGILMKAGHYDQARFDIEEARQLLGDAQWFDEADAVCCSELGDDEAADSIFSRLADPVHAGIAIARARHLLRVGRPEAAAECAWQAAQMPDGAAAWPYLATAWRLIEDSRWRWLEADPRLVGVMDLPISKGEIGDLATLLRRLHVSSHHPYDQSLRLGTQTSGSLLDRWDPDLRKLRALFTECVAQYIDQLPDPDLSHPVLGVPRDRFHFSGSWSSLLRSGGRHTNHVHPGGWISSAYYVDVPPLGGRGSSDPEGWLVLGKPPEELGIDLVPLRIIEPKPGRLVLFPSTMWHGTKPFPTGERLTVAFDVVPTG